MNVKVGTVLTDFDGNALKNDQSEPMTAGMVLINVLLTLYDDDKNLSGKDKIVRYELAKKIHKVDEVEMVASEITLCQMLVNKYCVPLILGQMVEIIEPKLDKE